MQHYVLIGTVTRSVFDWGPEATREELRRMRREWDLGEPTVIVPVDLAVALQSAR